MKIIGMILLVALSAFGGIIDITGGKWSAFQPFANTDTLKITCSVKQDTMDGIVDTVMHVWYTASNTLSTVESGNTKLWVLGTGRSWVDSGSGVNKRPPDSLWKAGRFYIPSTAGTANGGATNLIQTGSCIDSILKTQYITLKTFTALPNLRISHVPSGSNIRFSGNSRLFTFGDNDTMVFSTGQNYLSASDTFVKYGTGCVFSTSSAISNLTFGLGGAAGNTYLNVPQLVLGGVSINGGTGGNGTINLLNDIICDTSANTTIIMSSSGVGNAVRVGINTNGYKLVAKKITLPGDGSASTRCIINLSNSLLICDSIRQTSSASTHKTDTLNMQTATINCGSFIVLDTDIVVNAGTSTINSNRGSAATFRTSGKQLYDVNISRTTTGFTALDTLKAHTLTVAAGNTQAVSCSTLVLSGDITAQGTGNVTFRCCLYLTGTSSAFNLASTLGTVTMPNARTFFTGATDPTMDADKAVTFPHISAFRLRHTGSALVTIDSLTVLANGIYSLNDTQHIVSLRMGDSSQFLPWANTGVKIGAISDMSGSVGKLIRIVGSGATARIWPPAATTLSYVYVKDVEAKGNTIDVMDGTSANGGNTPGWLFPAVVNAARAVRRAFGFGFGFAF